jgi:glycosyltransferase involved in cell wall biosynthesis
MAADDPAVLRLRREWGLSAEHFAFAVVGGYDLPRGKGQREYLQAAARIHEQIPMARFLIIGRGNMRDILKADIARLGLSGKAWLTPYCNDMPAAMNAIDCLVHPQIGTEAFPSVLLEAFCSGKPVIASALDGIPEAFEVGGYGCLVKPEAVGDLAISLLGWAGQPSPSHHPRAELCQRVNERFSLSLSARSVNDLYERLVVGT